MDQRNRHITLIRRGCTNLEVRRSLIAALQAGARYRMTKKGIIIYGDDGLSVTAHFTISDHRGALNLRAQLRRMGLDTGTSKKRRAD